MKSDIGWHNNCREIVKNYLRFVSKPAPQLYPHPSCSLILLQYEVSETRQMSVFIVYIWPSWINSEPHAFHKNTLPTHLPFLSSGKSILGCTYSCSLLNGEKQPHALTLVPISHKKDHPAFSGGRRPSSKPRWHLWGRWGCQCKLNITFVIPFM